MHWLDEAIATLTREAARWKSSHGDKAESHATAAAILSKVAESGATHDEVKTSLSGAPAETAEPSPVVADVRDRVEVVPPVAPVPTE